MIVLGCHEGCQSERGPTTEVASIRQLGTQRNIGAHAARSLANVANHSARGGGSHATCHLRSPRAGPRTAGCEHRRPVS